VIAADTAGRVLLLNRVAEELTGWTSAEAVGKPLAEVFRLRDEQTRKPLDDFLAKVFASEGVIELNAPMLLVNREGKEVLVADSAAPIRNPASEVVGAVVVFRDVTEARRNAQEQNRLEKLKSLGVLAGGIAHDFNNLISVVMGDLSLLREKVAAGSEEGELTTDALRATGQARALTQQLLTFSKGGAPVKRSSSIRELVEESALFALHGSPCKCVCAAPPDLWLAEVDLGQIHQVVHNLALNAVQAMPGGGTLDIRMENVFLEEGGEAGLAAGRYIRITFRDEGSGISPENLPKIFDPYFTTKSTGTGLGLSTAYGIVDRHQGRITVMSDRSGSTFRIHLPALGISATPEGEPPTDSAGGGKSGKILVLDDDPAIQRICRRLLEHLGHRVEVAGTCDDAVAAYRKAFAAGAPPDLVILDLTIPGGRGGLAVLGELKEIDPKVRALVSSGYSQDPVMAHYREHGFVGLLRKPYALKELKETLAAVL
jgi:PAS domain S-box-containing protein